MFLTFLQSSIRFSAVFLFGSVGETLTEKSGNLNLGIPGIMCLGAAGGILGEAAYAASLPSLDYMTGAGAVLSESLGLGAILFSPLLLLISFLLMLRRQEEA